MQRYLKEHQRDFMPEDTKAAVSYTHLDVYKRQALPLPDTSKLGKLNRALEKSEKKLRKAINDEKALQHQLKQNKRLLVRLRRVVKPMRNKEKRNPNRNINN